MLRRKWDITKSVPGICTLKAGIRTCCVCSRDSGWSFPAAGLLPGWGSAPRCGLSTASSAPSAVSPECQEVNASHDSRSFVHTALENATRIIDQRSMLLGTGHYCAKCNEIMCSGLTVSPGFHPSALEEGFPWPHSTPPHMCYLLYSQHRCTREQDPGSNIKTNKVRKVMEYRWWQWRGARRRKNIYTCNCPGSTWECRTSSLCMQGRGEKQRHWLPPKFPSSPQASEWPGSYARCPDTLAALPHLWGKIKINHIKKVVSLATFNKVIITYLNNLKWETYAKNETQRNTPLKESTIRINTTQLFIILFIRHTVTRSAFYLIP